ncbi:branched-chain amino acid ABC transporter permease [Mesorhizobium sediminum]|nr:branched-chain amino acid ABC transporter permease [Mesorhizobium sediminum]
MNITHIKTVAFALSAAIAGLAGGLYSALLGFVAPESFNLEQMVLMKIMAVVGGLGTMLGSVIGPTLVIVLQEQLRESQGWLEIIFGATLIAFVLFVPKGIAPLLLRLLGHGPQVETVEVNSQTRRANAQATT